MPLCGYPPVVLRRHVRRYETTGCFFLATAADCATSNRVGRRRKIPQPNKHFRLVLWFLLYRVHPQQQINREVEVIACQSCRIPLCLFDRFKADFPHHWNQLLEKRSRRLTHLLKYIIRIPAKREADRVGRSIALTQGIPLRCHPNAHRDDGQRFVVHADELLTAFVELQSAIRACAE